MKKLNQKRSVLSGSKGFTLIELIVVIAILGILAGLVIMRIGSSSADARNARRTSDLNQIKTAIEQSKARGASINGTGGVNVNGGGAGCLVGAVPTYPCTRTVNDGILTLNGSPSPSSLLSGGVYPGDPQTNVINYRIRIQAAGNQDYVLIAPGAESGAIIQVNS